MKWSCKRSKTSGTLLYNKINKEIVYVKSKKEKLDMQWSLAKLRRLRFGYEMN
jgi:hypothetical protein